MRNYIILICLFTFQLVFLPHFSALAMDNEQPIRNLRFKTTAPAVEAELKGNAGNEDMNRPIKHILKKTADPGLVISPVNKKTSESGNGIKFSVRLKSQPIVNVEVNITSDHPKEGIPDRTTLTFTPKNWKTPQWVKVTGQDDLLDDGDRTYQIILKSRSSGDYQYANLKPVAVSLVNEDNDRAAIKVEVIKNDISESGEVAYLGVSLKSRPEKDVIINIRSSDTRDIKPKRSKIRIKPSDWNKSQVVEVIGVDDDIADGDKEVQLLFDPGESTDLIYKELEHIEVGLVCLDDDKAGIITKDVLEPTTEKGTKVRFEVRLQSRPEGKVNLTIDSDNPGEGTPDKEELIFDSKNWNQGQWVEVTGKDDAIDDGDQPYAIRIKAQSAFDFQYQTLPLHTVKLVNTDDDELGVEFNKTSGAISEDGGKDEFLIHLRSKPTDQVKLVFESAAPDEGDLTVKEFLFTPGNWKTPQVMEVIGKKDFQVDGDQIFGIHLKKVITADKVYKTLKLPLIPVINADTEKAGFVLDHAKGVTTEDGDTATFKLSLKTRPKAEVIVAIKSNNRAEGVVDKKQLKFTILNWNTPQSFTVKGLDDKQVDGHIAYNILISTEKSKDTDYFYVNTGNIAMVNRDNDTTSLIVGKSEGHTTEGGQVVPITVELDSKPAGEVAVVLKSTVPTEGKPIPEKLVFNPENWDQAQTVQVTGQDDFIRDDRQSYEIVLTTQSKTDLKYNQLTPIRVPLVNWDNDKPGVTLRVISNVTDENGKVAKFAVKLDCQPRSPVLFIFKSNREKEGRLLNEYAYFTPDVWNREQMIRIEGVKDNRVDGPQDYLVSTEGAVSNDSDFNNLLLKDVELVNKDRDSAEMVVSNVNGNTSEDGDTTTFTMRLNSIPEGVVSMNLESDTPSEGVVDIRKIEFTPDNWDDDQVITITGVDDGEKDRDRLYKIKFSPAYSIEDHNYHGVTPEPISVYNLDNRRMFFGAFPYRFKPGNELDRTIDEAYGYGLVLGYEYSREWKIDFSLLSVSAEGERKAVRYSRLHNVKYKWEMNSYLLGLRYLLTDVAGYFYLGGGGAIHSWTLTAEGQTEYYKKVTSGNDLGVYTGASYETSVAGVFFIGGEFNYHRIFGGLNESTFQTLALVLKYPF